MVKKKKRSHIILWKMTHVQVIITRQSLGCLCCYDRKQRQDCVSSFGQPVLWMLSLSFLNWKMRGLGQKTSKVPSSFEILRFYFEYSFSGIFDPEGTWGCCLACGSHFEHQWPLSGRPSADGEAWLIGWEITRLTVVTFFFSAAFLSSES